MTVPDGEGRALDSRIGDSITIFGSNFGQGVASETAASLHSLPCASISFMSSTQMVCVTPANTLNVNGLVACSQCNAHAVAVLVDINGLPGSLFKAFSFTNDGSTVRMPDWLGFRHQN